MFRAVAQLIAERKRHPHSVIALRLDIDTASQSKLPLRPARVVALQIVPDIFTILHAFVVVMNAIGEERRFGADLRIEPGEHKRADIITQPFGAEVWRRRTDDRGRRW